MDIFPLHSLPYYLLAVFSVSHLSEYEYRIKKKNGKRTKTAKRTIEGWIDLCYLDLFYAR